MFDNPPLLNGDVMPSDWDFPIETRPLYSRELFDGPFSEEPITSHSAIVRPDTGAVLGVHGKRYKPVKHDDIINSMMDAVKESDITSDYNLTVDVLEGGRKMKGTIMFPDQVIEPAVGDYIQFRVQFYNSYDGAWAFQQAADGLRLWCLNGCTTPDTIAKTFAKHTANISLAGSADKMLNGLDIFRNQEEVFQQYQRRMVTQDEVTNFLERTVCSVPQKSGRPKVNNARLEELSNQYDQERRSLGPNAWALYNALTYWGSHAADSKSPENAIRIRNNTIAKAMKSAAWEVLTSG